MSRVVLFAFVCHSRKFLAGIQCRSLCFCLSSPTLIGDPVSFSSRMKKAITLDPRRLPGSPIKSGTSVEDDKSKKEDHRLKLADPAHFHEVAVVGAASHAARRGRQETDSGMRCGKRKAALDAATTEEGR